MRLPLPDIGQGQRRGVDIVHRDVEETLDLVGVQVHGQHPVRPHDADHGRSHLGRDRHPCRAGPPVLPRITEIGDHRCHTRCRSALERIDHDQQFHEVVSGWGTGGLDDVDVTATDVFHDFDHDFAVAEAADNGLAHRHTEFVGDVAGERRVRVPRKHHQGRIGHRLFFP